MAYACARHLVEKKRSFTLFATHYFELTRLAQEFAQIANVHLDAVEHGEQIVFMHSVSEGPASQSYGLQVAQLAGVPNSVIQLAKNRLQQLEQQSIEQSRQGDLFAAHAMKTPPIQTHPVIEKLRDTQPDELSPKAALELVYQLKKLADK